jgi:hypothetical protein
MEVRFMFQKSNIVALATIVGLIGLSSSVQAQVTITYTPYSKIDAMTGAAGPEVTVTVQRYDQNANPVVIPPASSHPSVFTGKDTDEWKRSSDNAIVKILADEGIKCVKVNEQWYSNYGPVLRGIINDQHTWDIKYPGVVVSNNWSNQGPQTVPQQSFANVYDLVDQATNNQIKDANFGITQTVTRPAFSRII